MTNTNKNLRSSHIRLEVKFYQHWPNTYENFFQLFKNSRKFLKKFENFQLLTKHCKHLQNDPKIWNWWKIHENSRTKPKIIDTENLDEICRKLSKWFEHLRIQHFPVFTTKPGDIRKFAKFFNDLGKNYRKPSIINKISMVKRHVPRSLPPLSKHFPSPPNFDNFSISSHFRKYPKPDEKIQNHAPKCIPSLIVLPTKYISIQSS